MVVIYNHINVVSLYFMPRTAHIHFLFLITVLGVYHLDASAELSQNEIKNLLKCYKHTLDASKNEDKYRTAMSNFPKSDLYKLFIDKERLKNPRGKEKAELPHRIFDVD